MASVDSRIVTMKLDNRQFLDGVKTVLSALAQLKGAAGLQDAQASANRFNLNSVEESTNRVSAGFIALSTIAITALSNITNRAVNAGVSLVKSLSLDQVVAGFQEYELNIKSIQTILANTKKEGTNLQQVNSALDELNNYADKTIYNFAEMTRNIGTFTAAGVDLDTSVQSIKGIANLAAISGSSSQQASTAMYQLSQAISSGTVKLMDWNSVVNAGMGGQVFQEALFETGKTLGTIADVPIDKTFDEWTKSGGNFRESLQEGWITSEVLTTTLQGFTGELDKAQLKAIGYTDEQIKNIQELGQTGVEAATKVRTFTQLIDTAKEAVASGWSQTFRTVIGDFDEATELFTRVSGVFDKFISDSSSKRNELLAGWKEAGGRDDLLEGLENIFTSLGKVLGTVRDAFRDVFPRTTVDELVSMTKRFKEFTEGLRPTPETLDKIGRIARGVFSIFAIGINVIKAVASFIGGLVGALFKGAGGFLSLAASVSDFFTDLNKGTGELNFFATLTDKVGEGAEKLGGIFSSLGDFLAPALEKLREFGTNALESLRDGISNIDWGLVFAGIGAGALGGVALSVKKFLGDILDFDISGGIIDQISDALETFTGVLKGIQQNLQANALLKIGAAIAILAAALLVLSTIDPEDLVRAMTGVATGMTILLGAMATLTKISASPGFGKIPVVMAGLIGLSTAVLILSFAVKKLSGLKWDEIAKGLTGVAGAVGIIVAAVKPLSKNSKGLITAGIGLIALSAAMLIMASAIEKMAALDWDEVGKGLLGVAGSLGVLIGAIKLMPKNVAVKAAGLVIMGGALILISRAVAQFAGRDLGETSKGLILIAVALGIIAGALKIMPKNAPILAAGLLIVSFALSKIADAVEQFGGNDIGTIAKGLITMALALGILAVTLSLMSGTVAGALALVLAAGAINLIVPALQALALLSWGDIIKGLLALAGAMVVIGVGAAIFGLAAPLLLLGGAALLVFGVGLTAVGIAALAFARAFEIAVRAAGAGGEVIKTAFDAAIEAIPRAIKAFGKGVVEFVKVIGASQKEFVKAFSSVLGALLDAVIQNVPKMEKAFNKIIGAGIRTIRKWFPEILETGIDLLLRFLDGVGRKIPEIVTKATDLIVRFLNTLARNTGRLIRAGANLLISVINGLQGQMNRIAEAGANAVIRFINGLASTIRRKSGEVREAGRNLAGAIIDGMTGGLFSGIGRVAEAARSAARSALNAAKNFLGISSPSKAFHEVGRYSSVGLADGIVDYSREVEKASEEVAATALSTLRTSMRGLGDVISGEVNMKPVLTPILDLSQVRKDASTVGNMFDSQNLRPTVSVARATSISADRQAALQDAAARDEEARREAIQFVQNNYSPEALSTIDIYRQTRQQLELAKEAMRSS